MRYHFSKHPLMLVLAPLIALALFSTDPIAQAPSQADNFSACCTRCWSKWTEIFRPAHGVGPSERNGLGFIFINGFNLDPALNRQHLQFDHVADPIYGINELSAQFKFNNATIGGKLPYTNGRFDCLSESEVIVFVTNELLLMTLRDNVNSWYGAFIGDFTLLEPNFVPEPENPTPRSYTTIGLVQKTESGLEVLAVKVIPTIRRFMPINCRVTIDESPGNVPNLRAEFGLGNGSRYSVMSEIDPRDVPNNGKAGIIYLVGSALPCTNLPQREVAFDRFEIRYNPSLN